MTEILGVRIDNLNKKDALDKVRGFLAGDKQNFIFTPNPEMLVDAYSDGYFKNVLNSGDLNISDGFGVSLVSGGKIKRITGSDFMLDICALGQTENKSIFLLGSNSEIVLEKTAVKLKQLFPKLKITGFNLGPKVDYLIVEDDKKIFYTGEANDQAIHEIIMTAPDILFVAFGHNKQEKWIYENIKNLPSVKVAMGVGGAFDYLSGTVKRAPCFMRKIGLEWLYRLFVQPSRLKRILKATVAFLGLMIYNFFKK